MAGAGKESRKTSLNKSFHIISSGVYLRVMKYLCSKKVLMFFNRVTLFFFFEIFRTLPTAIAYALHDKKLMKNPTTFLSSLQVGGVLCSVPYFSSSLYAF